MSTLATRTHGPRAHTLLALAPLALAPWAVLAACSSSTSLAPTTDVATDAAAEAAPESGTEAGADAAADTGADAAPDAAIVTTLRVHYPAGSHSIALRGSGGPWDWSKGVAFTAGADDTWTYATTAISAPLEWKPLLDDATWSRGPNYHVKPGDTLDVYPHFTQVKGKYEVRWPKFHSATLGNDRGVWVYSPPTLLENPRARFPVVYMHDGQNLFDASTAFGGTEWKVDESCDQAAEDGSFPEVIVIGVENTANRIWEYTPTKDATVGDGGGADKYLTMLTAELMPQVDAALPTLKDPKNTAIVGSSLGGLVSAYAGAEYPSTFGLLGVMSPSTWWDSSVILGVAKTAAAKTPRALRIYVDSGDSGTSNDDVIETTQLAQTWIDGGYVEGVDLHHVIQAGAIHNEYYWAQRFPWAMQFLLGPGR
jgi:predicted alpha/beta superfamily hydrolase